MSDESTPKERGLHLHGVSHHEMEAYVDARLAALSLGAPAALAAPAAPPAAPTAHAVARHAPPGLQAAYDQLSKKYEELLAAKTSAPTSRVSDEALSGFVDALLADPAVNLRFVPDVIEGAVYRNVLKMVLHSIAHTSETAGFEIFGHRLRLVIEPSGPKTQEALPEAGRSGPH